MTDIEISDPHSAGEAHGCPEECPAHNPGGPDVAPTTVAGVPAELRDLPVEVRHLVHAVDRMCDWAESSDERKRELWTGIHAASEAVWNRTIPDAASQSRTTPDNPAGSGDPADNPGADCDRCGHSEGEGCGCPPVPTTYPHADGEFTVLGPEIFASRDGTVISWKGQNYERQAEDELTAAEARDLADQLGLELYQAQDALDFVEECCVIADREGLPVTTALVRQWLQGPQCGRQMLAGPILPERAQAAIRALEQQVAVRDRQLAEVREYVRTRDDDGIRTREQVLRILGGAGEVGP